MDGGNVSQHDDLDSDDKQDDAPEQAQKTDGPQRQHLFSPQPDKSSLVQSLFSFEPIPKRPPVPINIYSVANSTGTSPPPRPFSPLPSHQQQQNNHQQCQQPKHHPNHHHHHPHHNNTPHYSNHYHNHHAHSHHNHSHAHQPHRSHTSSSNQTSSSVIATAGQLFMPFRPPPPPPTLDRPLQLFNRLQDFYLLRTLGTGTFGRVKLAKYREIDKFFAMKIMRKADVVTYKQEKHVMNERWLLAKLNFPFVIRLYAAFQDAKNLYLLLEYAIGGELYSYLRRSGRFSLPTTKFYAAEIMMAIEYLHNMDIAYRDLKPENLLLDSKGHIKLSDFGFAKHVPDITWTLCGTPEYLAPEIIANRGHGKAVDWWALGILVYEMLAGFPPYYDQTPFGTYEKILAGRLTFPSHFDLMSIDLIRRLLQPDPVLRLGNLQGGAQDIRRHPWFAGVDWNGLYRRTIMAPIQPRVQHSGDTGNFDRYPEDADTATAVGDHDPYSELFKSF